MPLELESDLRVVAEAASGAELRSLLQTARPDVLVLDIALPDMSGIELARQVAKECPGLAIVMLSGYTDRLFVEEAMKSGALAFVAKSAGADELVFAIRCASAGKVFISPEVAGEVIRQVVAPETREAPPMSVLGRREQEVLRLLAEGRSSPEIAAEMGISPSTVDVHRRNIKQKLNLRSIADLTRYAIREGLGSVNKL